MGRGSFRQVYGVHGAGNAHIRSKVLLAGGVGLIVSVACVKLPQTSTQSGMRCVHATGTWAWYSHREVVGAVVMYYCCISLVVHGQSAPTAHAPPRAPYAYDYQYEQSQLAGLVLAPYRPPADPSSRRRDRRRAENSHLHDDAAVLQWPCSGTLPWGGMRRCVACESSPPHARPRVARAPCTSLPPILAFSSRNSTSTKEPSPFMTVRALPCSSLRHPPR